LKDAIHGRYRVCWQSVLKTAPVMKGVHSKAAYDIYIQCWQASFIKGDFACSAICNQVAC